MLERDLGARRGGKPLAFGSRVEVFEGSSNTLADRTRPAIWLGSKGNAYGSGVFFLLDTEKVVARDQWRALPMDLGTIDRINKIAQKGPMVPKRVPVYFRGQEVQDDEPSAVDTTVPPAAGLRVVVDSGHSMPDPTVRWEPELSAADYDIVRADELFDGAPLADPLVQLETEPETNVADSAVSSRGTSVQDGGDSTRHSVSPVVVASQAPERPVQQAGVPDPGAASTAQPETGVRRSGRERRAPTRYQDYVSMWALSHNEALFKSTEIAAGPKTKELGVGLRGRSRVSAAFEGFEKRREKHMIASGETAYHLSVDAAIKSFGKKAIKSMSKELTGIHLKGVFTQVRQRDLTQAQRRSIIRSSMFLKEKK